MQSWQGNRSSMASFWPCSAAMRAPCINSRQPSSNHASRSVPWPARPLLCCGPADRVLVFRLAVVEILHEVLKVLCAERALVGFEGRRRRHVPRHGLPAPRERVGLGGVGLHRPPVLRRRDGRGVLRRSLGEEARDLGELGIGDLAALAVGVGGGSTAPSTCSRPYGGAARLGLMSGCLAARWTGTAQPDGLGRPGGACPPDRSEPTCSQCSTDTCPSWCSW